MASLLKIISIITLFSFFSSYSDARHPNISNYIINPLKIASDLKDKGTEGLQKVGQIAKNVTDFKNPLKIASDLKDKGTEGLQKVGQIAKNVTNGLNEVVARTGTVFITNNASLNCLGLPTAIFDKVIELLTDETKVNDIKFYFASRNQPDYVTVQIINDKFDLDPVDYDIGRDTLVLCHGFLSNGEEQWLLNMKDALLKYGDYNVIVVDWSKGSNTWNYAMAASSTRLVGNQIAKLFGLIRELTFSRGFTDVSQWGKLHLIGHSLGSHISGRAAYMIKQSQKEKPDSEAWLVDRITGLDPAQPCFVSVDPALKLDKDDARYVDVIHTNARQLILLGLGLPERLGHVDFYPNGGQIQPGCSDIDVSKWNLIPIPKNLIHTIFCSHGRSHTFFTESVLDAVAGNCSFIGHRWNLKYSNIEKLVSDAPCTDDVCPEMGITSIEFFPGNEGTYFVPTGENAPYCSLTPESRKLVQKQLEDDKSLKNVNIINLWPKVAG